jgi:NAD(P)-dependent dehydrogenase (short-subunit alcohol dehydrogenase family)
LAQEGWEVAIAGRRREALEETASLANGSRGGRIVSHPCDLTNPAEIASFFFWLDGVFPRLDLLFNNAGITAPAIPMEELTIDQWQTVLATNLSAPFLCAQQAIRRMKAQSPQGGRIINNGSISAHSPRPHSAPYTATKHAITGLTKSIALDGRAYNIACGQIDIGNAASDMTARMTTGALQPDGTLKPEPRMDLRHVARAVLQMASLPLEANVLHMTIMATEMPFVGRG